MTEQGQQAGEWHWDENGHVCCCTGSYQTHARRYLVTPELLNAQQAELRTLREQVESYRDAGLKLTAALSRIDYALGPPNDMQVSLYDVDNDEERVMARAEAAQKRAEAWRQLAKDALSTPVSQTWNATNYRQALQGLYEALERSEEAK